MKIVWMFVFFCISLIFSGCNEKIKNKNEEKDEMISENLPQENIWVNKEYDEDGNLIRYDSTYTYYFSKAMENKAIADSIFKNFQKMFSESYPFSTKPYFDKLFFQDSLLKYDFYKKDFFYNRFRQNMQLLDKLFFEMDSVKNNYFLKQFPDPDRK